jgi:hypothetical protein
MGSFASPTRTRPSPTDNHLSTVVRCAPVGLSVFFETPRAEARGSSTYLWLYRLKELLWALRKTRATTILTRPGTPTRITSPSGGSSTRTATEGPHRTAMSNPTWAASDQGRGLRGRREAATTRRTDHSPRSLSCSPRRPRGHPHCPPRAWRTACPPRPRRRTRRTGGRGHALWHRPTGLYGPHLDAAPPKSMTHPRHRPHGPPSNISGVATLHGTGRSVFCHLGGSRGHPRDLPDVPVGVGGPVPGHRPVVPRLRVRGPAGGDPLPSVAGQAGRPPVAQVASQVARAVSGRNVSRVGSTAWERSLTTKPAAVALVNRGWNEYTGWAEHAPDRSTSLALRLTKITRGMATPRSRTAGEGTDTGRTGVSGPAHTRRGPRVGQTAGRERRVPCRGRRRGGGPQAGVCRKQVSPNVRGTRTATSHAREPGGCDGHAASGPGDVSRGKDGPESNSGFEKRRLAWGARERVPLQLARNLDLNETGPVARSRPVMAPWRGERAIAGS